MSFHIAVILTSEKCGHCRTMRGSGRALSQKEIKEKSLPTSIPGGYHYDSKFIKKLITADSDSPKLRILNVHYRSFNPADGVSDISVFTLEPDNRSIRQVILKESEGKTVADTYVIGDTGKKTGTQEVPNSWNDTVKLYLPSNLTSYAYFYPTISIFNLESWISSIKNNEPVFGYINGMPTREEVPYGGMPGQNPNPISDFSVFLKGFFDGTRNLLVKPPAKQNIPEPPKIENLDSQVQNLDSKVKENPLLESPKPSKVLRVPTVAACENLHVKLYVKE
jgi:hypothetical protein